MGRTDGVNSGHSSFLCLDSSSLAGGGCCSFVARLLVLRQDAITSNQLAVHIIMVTIHLMSLSMSLVVQLWIPEHMGHLYGFLFFITEFWCFGRSFTIWDQIISDAVALICSEEVSILCGHC
jgi:hypothetical protein